MLYAVLEEHAEAFFAQMGATQSRTSIIATQSSATQSRTSIIAGIEDAQSRTSIIARIGVQGDAVRDDRASAALDGCPCVIDGCPWACRLVPGCPEPAGAEARGAADDAAARLEYAVDPGDRRVAVDEQVQHVDCQHRIQRTLGNSKRVGIRARCPAVAGQAVLSCTTPRLLVASAARCPGPGWRRAVKVGFVGKVWKTTMRV